MTTQLTQNELFIITTLRQQRRDSKGQPFQIIVRFPGGNTPFQVMRAEPLHQPNGNGAGHVDIVLERD